MHDCTDADNDAPTLLVYAPTPWIQRRDSHGDLHDDDCADCDEPRDEQADPDIDWRTWNPIRPCDCGDGLPDGCDLGHDIPDDGDDLPF